MNTLDSESYDMISNGDDDEDGDDLFWHWPWRINSVKAVGVKAGEVKHLAVVKVCIQVVHGYLKLMMMG